MPRYFFDVADQGRGDPNEEDTIHADVQAARVGAIVAIAHMTKDGLSDENSHDFFASIRDESGKVFFRAALMLRAEWVD